MSYLINDKIGNNFDYVFNIIIVGYSYMEKSCVFRRYIHDSFSECPILSIYGERKFIEINNKIFKLNIYNDSKGSERFRSLPISLYRKPHYSLSY